MNLRNELNLWLFYLINLIWNFKPFDERNWWLKQHSNTSMKMKKKTDRRCQDWESVVVGRNDLHGGGEKKRLLIARVKATVSHIFVWIEKCNLCLFFIIRKKIETWHGVVCLIDQTVEFDTKALCLSQVKGKGTESLSLLILIKWERNCDNNKEIWKGKSGIENLLRNSSPAEMVQARPHCAYLQHKQNLNVKFLYVP